MAKNKKHFGKIFYGNIFMAKYFMAKYSLAAIKQQSPYYAYAIQLFFLFCCSVYL